MCENAGQKGAVSDEQEETALEVSAPDEIIAASQLLT